MIEILKKQLEIYKEILKISEDKTDIMSALIDATYDLMSARVKADAALAKTSVPAKKIKTAAPEKIFKGNAKARNKRVPAAGTGDSVA